MNITFLDASTVDSGDINFNEIKQFGNLTTYSNSTSNNTAERIKESEIVITNKVILDKEIIETAENLKLILTFLIDSFFYRAVPLCSRSFIKVKR